MKGEPLIIGRSAPRADAYAKVTGREKYAADFYPDNVAWVGVKRSAYAHACIKKIDVTNAANIDGVVTVLTAADIKGSNRLGIFEKDQPVLADEVVRYYGDAVALVLADDKDSLRQALAAVVVEYEPLPAVHCPEMAQRDDAPLLYPDRAEGNILLQGEIVAGDGAKALAGCAHTVALSLRLGWQEHAYLETETGVAWLEEGDNLHIIASTQTPFRDRFELSHALGIAPEKIQVEAPYLGGGFGGKDGVTVQGFLALAALHSDRRPVKIWYSREESFLAGTKRHPVIMHYRLGCDAQGYLQALDCELIFDTGAYASLGGEILTLAMEHAGGPYRIPHATISGKAVYTNNLVGGAFRGFGVTQTTAALEQVVDELAKTAGFDLLDFRLKNAVRLGDTTAAGVVLTQTTGIVDCLEAVKKDPLWQARREWEKSAPPFKLRGVGIAALMHGIGFGPVIPDNANAKLEITVEGDFLVYAGVADMGQGNISTYLQIAGHVLWQPPENIRAILPDTKKTLPSGSSSASRTTFTFGNALIGAAETLRERLLAKAALLFSFQLLSNVKTEDLAILPGRILHLLSGRELPLAAVAKFMDLAERVVTNSYTCPVNRQVLPTGGNLSLHGYPHRVFSYGVQLAAVEVDALTGEAAVCDFLSCIDGGRVLNPQLYEQQVQGGAAQGIGYALYEDFAVDAGRLVTKDFATYILPTSLDIPDMRLTPVELAEPDGPFGMKGIGEIIINGPYPAIANALAAAGGVRNAAGVLTAERILGLIDRMEEKSRC